MVVFSNFIAYSSSLPLVVALQVSVLGCPAEEGGGGKVDLIEAGVLGEVDVAMMAHPGKINAPSTPILTCTE